MSPFHKFNRRNWLKMLGLFSIGTISKPLTGCTDPLTKGRTVGSSLQLEPEYKTYFGDLHNHNEVGQFSGKGRPRSE